jgi:hypothetical protein
VKNGGRQPELRTGEKPRRMRRRKAREEKPRGE